MVKEKKKPKRAKLPPMTLKGYDTFLRNQGFRPDPVLQGPSDADHTYVKPLPNGSRLHLEVKKGRKYINIEEHTDKIDPGRSPIGHFVKDVLLDEPKHSKYRIPLRKKKKK